MSTLFSYVSKHLNFIVLLVICMLLSCYPYVFNRLVHLGSETDLMIGFIFVFFLLFFLGKKSRCKFPNYFKVCIIIQIVIWLFYYLLHSDGSYLSRVFIIVLTTLSLSALKKYNSLYLFTATNNTWITSMSIMGVPVFFMFALGMIQPIYEFTNIDGRYCYYFGLTCSNAITSGICRVAGFFDEPGAMAFWGVYSLILNKLYFDSRKIEIGLIISLLCTLSAAYFIQLALYLLFFYSNKTRNMLVLVFMIALAGYFTYSKLGANEQIAYMTIERFQGGQIRTDRIELSERAQRIFLESPIIGIGAKKLQSRGYFDDNPYEILAKDGIIGLIITYFPLFIVIWRYGLRNKNFLFACIILSAGYLQRPFHVNLLHYFMLYLFVLLAYYKYEKNYAYV